MIIFINGYWGKLSYALFGGQRAHWDTRGKWVQQVKDHVGDQHAWYFDGSANKQGSRGGFQALPYILSDKYRYESGLQNGERYAAALLNALARNAGGHISESIKYITSSMGAVWQRGFSQALENYVRQHLAACRGYRVEYVVDLDAFLSQRIDKKLLNPDPYAAKSFYMRSNYSQAHMVERLLGLDVPGAEYIGTDEEGHSLMHAHHPSYAPPAAFPHSQAGSPQRKDVERPPGEGALID